MKTLYFTDYLYNEDYIQDEMDRINYQLMIPLGNKDLMVTEYTHDPPFKGFAEEKYYDVLFFDWGGVMDVCFSMVSNFIECILKEANECPNKYYVVTSSFEMLLEEFQSLVEQEFNGQKPFNIFLSVEDFVEYYKKYNL